MSYGSKMPYLACGLIGGIAIGMVMSSNHLSASANPSGTAIQALSNAVKKNAVEISKLQRQVRALSSQTAKLNGKARGNRNAVNAIRSAIRTRSGIIIDFNDQ